MNWYDFFLSLLILYLLLHMMQYINGLFVNCTQPFFQHVSQALFFIHLSHGMSKLDEQYKFPSLSCIACVLSCSNNWAQDCHIKFIETEREWKKINFSLLLLFSFHGNWHKENRTMKSLLIHYPFCLFRGALIFYFHFLHCSVPHSRISLTQV